MRNNQASNSKHQTNPNNQITKFQTRGLIIGIWILVFVWNLGFGVWNFDAAAETTGFTFSVEPSRVELSIPAGKRRGKSLTVDNAKSSDPVHLKIYVQDVTYLPDGTNDFLPPGSTAWSCANWLEIGPMELDIPARKSAEVRLSALAPEGAQGGHYAIVFFETSPSYAEPGGIGMNFRIGALVEIVVPGTEQRRASLTNLSVAPGGIILADLRNDGNVLVRPKGKLKFLDASGARVFQTDFNPNRIGVLPNSTRQFETKLERHLSPGTYRLRAEIDYGTKELLIGEMDLTVK